MKFERDAKNMVSRKTVKHDFPPNTDANITETLFRYDPDQRLVESRTINEDSSLTRTYFYEDESHAQLPTTVIEKENGIVALKKIHAYNTHGERVKTTRKRAGTETTTLYEYEYATQ